MKLKTSNELANQGQPESANGLAGREVRPTRAFRRRGLPWARSLLAGLFLAFRAVKSLWERPRLLREDLERPPQDSTGLLGTRQKVGYASRDLGELFQVLSPMKPGSGRLDWLCRGKEALLRSQ